MRWYPGLTIAAAEKICIQDAMKFYEGRKSEVALALDISSKTLYNKLEEYENEEADKNRREAEDQRRRDAWIAEQKGQVVTPYNPANVETYEEDAPVGLPRRADETVDTGEPQKAAGGRRGR